MLKPLKVATPPTAVPVVAPDRVPPAGLVPIVTVTLPVNPGTRFPSRSRALTCTAGAIARPASALLGGTVNASCVAVPAMMLKAVLGGPAARAVVVAVSV